MNIFWILRKNGQVYFLEFENNGRVYFLELEKNWAGEYILEFVKNKMNRGIQKNFKTGTKENKHM